jgi:hypothetical protein
MIKAIHRLSVVKRRVGSWSGQVIAPRALGLAGVLLLAGTGSSAFAAKDGLCKDGTPRPCKPGSTGDDSGSNNLSFPIIFSDNVSPNGFPQDGPWRFADITDVTTCIDEYGVADGTSVPPEFLCYYGRKINVVNEEGQVGAIEFEPYPEEPAGYCDDNEDPAACKVWWLQKRTDNFWRALSTGHDISTSLIVSAVDVGDLLESTPELNARIIRVEFNLLQDVTQHDDGEFTDFLVSDWTNDIPAPCTVPDETGESVGCFAALGMSGAVPGTEQSGNEMQGTDFGPGSFASGFPGTQTLLDPTELRKAVYYEGETEMSIPVHALVYSHCARLVIQKIDGEPVWDPGAGQWTGVGVGAPLVNEASYEGWSVEITSSGSIVYGYNWNAKTAAVGDYRLTFVLDGKDSEGPQCPVTRGTTFGDNGFETTRLVNFGDVYQPVLLLEGNPALGDEGGLVYIDVPLAPKGGGGGGGGKKPNQ